MSGFSRWAPKITVVATLFVAMGCHEVPTTAPSLAPQKTPSKIDFSSGFYQTADGFYAWDGQPPPTDMDPADILEATASGFPPGPTTSGWISGHMVYMYGDQWKIDLTLDATRNGSPIFLGSSYSSGYKWPYIPYAAARNSTNEGSYEVPLYGQIDINTPPCNYTLAAGGTARARKAVPFGISVSLLKAIDGGNPFSLSLGAVGWGEVSRALVAWSSTGPLCDEDFAQYECDDPNTPQMDYCTQPGDPALKPGGPAAGPGGTPVNTGLEGGPGGSGNSGGSTEVCVKWIDWYYSTDGGNTWRYDGRECTNYALM